MGSFKFGVSILFFGLEPLIRVFITPHRGFTFMLHGYIFLISFGEKWAGNIKALHNEFAPLHGEFTVLHGEFTVSHGEFIVLHDEFTVLNDEFNSQHNEFELFFSV
ncbi:hypothetical protein A3860_04085 [Niastella vici]|uniref:Uncharacterized protein n=1 Tax=Niastella vici TaxID=1703345 RepID=A0A1V9FRK5_9BACT|nr:hypothetical protein [Niastella vici]OQP60917.1 hypothetical protein A3860_04085 [Niastella vici]